MSQKLELILERVSATHAQLWACRGSGKGCKRNGYREKKKHCEDCKGPLPDHMTIGEVAESLKKGDA